MKPSIYIKMMKIILILDQSIWNSQLIHESNS